MNSCKPDIDAIKNNLRARYRQQVKDELPNNGACELAFVVMDVLLELTGEMFAQYDWDIRESIGNDKTLREPMN